MAEKTIKELNAEIKKLNKVISEKDESIAGINDSIEAANIAIEENETLKNKVSELEKNINPDTKKLLNKIEELEGDKDILNGEIKDLKTSDKNTAPREPSVKEKGYTTVMDVKKNRDEAAKNAPDADSKK